MSPARRHLEFGADVVGHLSRVELDEMPDAVMRDAPEFGPVAQRADRGLLVLRKNSAETQTDDVRELALTE